LKKQVKVCLNEFLFTQKLKSTRKGYSNILFRNLCFCYLYIDRQYWIIYFNWIFVL